VIECFGSKLSKKSYISRYYPNGYILYVLLWYLYLKYINKSSSDNAIPIWIKNYVFNIFAFFQTLIYHTDNPNENQSLGVIMTENSPLNKSIIGVNKVYIQEHSTLLSSLSISFGQTLLIFLTECLAISTCLPQ
jgi:hypothetical protein